MSQYKRVVIQGELRCLSELHMGSGTQGKRGENDASHNEIVLDCDGQPIIPASSLRGYLGQHLVEPGFHATLFGKTEKMGALRVYDARLSSGQSWSELRRARIQVDDISRTAAENKLFNDILVPRGTLFQAHLELDGVDDQELKAVLDTLSSLNKDNPLARLGQGKSHGRGQLEWKELSVRTLDKEAFAGWLKSEDQPLDEAGWKEFEHEASFIPASEVWTLQYRFDEPVLINDPTLVKPKRCSEDQEPDMRFMRTETGEPLLPGSSQKGLFRARARRILLTMGAEKARADALLGTLFGSPEGVGIFMWYDALAGRVEKHEQYMIAIDRFTGSVKDGAMLHLEAARVDVARANLAFRKPLEGWQRALWLLVLRDAMEGDLALGWGQARGFGGFHLEFTPHEGYSYNEFSGYRDSRETGEWKKDFDELEAVIKGIEAGEDAA